MVSKVICIKNFLNGNFQFFSVGDKCTILNSSSEKSIISKNNGMGIYFYTHLIPEYFETLKARRDRIINELI